MRFSLIVKASIFLSFIFLISNSALADEIYLKNGDLITGEIGTSEDGRIVLKTPYAKKIEVEWDEVVCITSEKELTLLLKNNEKITGTAKCTTLGSIELKDPKTGQTRELSLADLQIVNPPPPPPPWTYKALVDVGGSIINGNTDKKTFNSSGRFVARSEIHRVFLEGKLNWGESDGKEDEQNWLTGAKYDYFFTKKFYAFFRPLAEHDRFQDLNLRYIIGAGPGYQIIDTEWTSLLVETGPAYVNEDYDDESDNEYISVRWSVGARWHIIRERVIFFHLQEGYYDLTSDEGLYLRTEQGLRLPLIKNFYFNMEFDWKYKSDPPSGNDKSDTALIFGLGYELNF